ncbi:Na+/H+ antiporter [Frankia sp. Cj3]|uniref:Na+/H+ antiporter n=1 Tax=Frankia sp. Cj3 TaxID=2880976 RepID=UPI001EF6BB77|nr:Na+/H+ antiporter [Frankia sp. Cj3]
MRAVGTLLFLVVLATAVATGARRWRVPAPPLLVLAGLGLAFIPGAPTLRIAPQVIGLVVLPPLLYASAEELSLRDLRTVWRPVTALASGLVLASAAAVGALVVVLTPLPAAMAFVLGAVLASTDPVAVTALGRRLALPGRVQVLVQAESLFNDATSLVLFKVAVTVAVASGAVGWQAASGQFFLLTGGGSAVGAAVAAVVAIIRRHTTDPELETVIALVTPYSAYVLAESAHASGITAVVVAGVLLGRSRQRLSDAHIRLQLHAVYAVVVFLLESVVFSIIGLELPSLIRELPAGTGLWPLQALAVAAALIILRVLWMLPLSAVVRPTEGRPSWQLASVMTWAGTRGVMPLAAALSIPLSATDGTPLPGRPLVLTLTTAVVVFTLVVQGLSLAHVVGRSGVALEPEHTAREETRARSLLTHAGLIHLDHLTRLESIPEAAVTRMRRNLDASLEQPAEYSDDQSGRTSLQAYRELHREVLVVQSVELRRLYDEHQISDTTRRRLQHDLDLEEAALGRR